MHSPWLPIQKQTITSKEDLLKQLKIIRSQGYAVDKEETETGVSAIAAPICNNQGKVVAAMSIPARSAGLMTSAESEMVESLKQAALDYLPPTGLQTITRPSSIPINRHPR